MNDQDTACTKGSSKQSNVSLRQDEHMQLISCRRYAIGTAFVSGGVAWLLTRIILKNPMIQKSFIGHNSLLVYTVTIGVAVYKGIISTAKSCFQGLASLENSRLSEIGKRALQMIEDHKTLSRREYAEKYPPHVQKKIFDSTAIFKAASLPTDPSTSTTPESYQQDMFHPAKDSEPSNKPKSFQELQNENRSKQDRSVYSFPEYKPKLQQPRRPTKQFEDSNLPPSGLDGKSKPKRNEYGDVVYED